MYRLGLFTGSGVLGALIVPVLVLVTALATGGDIFSAGPLNADRGATPVGGAWSHADLACGDCHAPFWTSTLMGDRCLDCHTGIAEELATPNSLHAGIASPETCRQCHPEHRGSHATLTLYAPDLYPHAEFGFYLISHLSHADGRPFDCSDCHVDTSQAFSQDTCIGCHQDLDPAWMATHGLDFGFDCLACHDGIDTYGKAFEHQVTAFPLEGLHLDLACSTCHGGAGSLDDLRATPAGCVTCHAGEDAHQGSLGTDCAACHRPSGWGTADLDHSLTAFPLAGRHLDVACESCHIGGQLAGIPTLCADCHRADDTHAGKFGTDCATCHTAEDWSIIIDENFDHRLTGFSLTGAHAQVATCAGCHAGGRFAGTPTRCVECHAADDAHDGDFGTDCSDCHTTSAWSPAEFDHDRTGFALSGGHAGVECARCHPGERFRDTPTECVDCHASDDAHDGAFGTDCGSCHSTIRWGGASFNHNNTAFPLTGSHSGATCTQCHANGVYDGTPTRCVDCHASDDAHSGGFGAECGSCHDTSDWRSASVDHDNTGFPLTGRHTSAACTQCHSGGVYEGTPTSCAACHNAPSSHPGFYGSDCTTCHNTSDWSVRYSGSHTFPLKHKGADSQCTTCHTDSFSSYTCYNCHDPERAQRQHEEISDLSDCAACHPDGRKD